MIGDGPMAIFGAPLPLAHPAGAAVRAPRERIEQFSAERVEAGQVPIRIGIGIALGEAVAGCSGTRRRAPCTWVSETVNRASRLEAHTRTCGHAVLIDAMTAGALGKGDVVEQLVDTQFHGIAAPVEAYAAA